MNGNFPPQEGYRHELAYGSNTPQECQGLENTNDVSAHKEEVTADGNDGERSGDFSHTIWPPTAQNKGTDKRDGSFSKDFSPDCQGTLTVMAADLGNYSFHQVNEHPVRTNIGHIADDDGERTAADRRERYNFVNDCVDLAAASTNSSHVLVQERDEELKSGSSSNWMSVIKESLEMSNGIELEPDLSCSTSMVYEEPLLRGVEPVKDRFVSVDYRCPDVHEESKTEVNSAQDSSVVVLSDATKISSVKLNQDVQREVNLLTGDSSINDKVFKKTSYRTLEQCSTLGFCNNTEIRILEQPAEHKEVSGHTVRSCLSDELSAVRANIEGQSKNASDIRKNTEGTLLATAPQLRQTSKDDSDDSHRICVDSQAKLCEDYCSKGNVEHDSQNIQDNIDQRIWYNCAESEMKMKLSTLEDQKPGVSHSGFVPMESSWSSDITVKGTSESSHLPLKHKVERYAEHHSECSSTSVTKLENLVHNLYKMVPQGGSLNMTTNAEYTQTKEVVSTPEAACSAVQNPPKLVKNQKTTNKRDTATHEKPLDPSVFQQSAAKPGDLASGKIPSTKANHHDFEKHDSSAEQMTKNLAQPSEKQNRSQQETMNYCNTSEFPQQYSLKNVQENLPSGTSEHVPQNAKNVPSRRKTPRKRKTLDSEVLTGHEQSLTSVSRKTSGDIPKTNVEILSFQKEGLTKEVCHATSVSQRTREKLKKKEKSSGPAKKTSTLSEEQLLVTSNAMVPTIKQECNDITLINEDKHEEQTGIKLQNNCMSQTVSQREDCLPLVPIPDAQRPVKVKSHVKKAKTPQRSTDITFNIKEEALSYDISKPFSSSDCQSEEINSTPDVQNLESKIRTRRHSNKDIKSVTIKAEGQNFLEEPVYSEEHATSACSAQNTLRKTKNSRIKAPYLQLSLESPTIVETSKEHAKRVNVNAKEPQPVKKKARKLDAHLSPEIQPSKKFENSFQPEVRDYLKKLRKRASTSTKDFFVCKTTAKNVKLEPDFYPVTCENVSDFLKNETVSSSPELYKDYAPKHTKNEQKMDHLKSIKTHIVRKKRAGHSKRRKLKKLVKSLSAVHETSESITSQDTISQNDASKHPIKVEVNSENTQTADLSRRSCRLRQNNPFSSVQTCSGISLVLSHSCESPEHEQTILSHPGCTMDTADSEKMSSNSTLSSARQKSPRRKSTRLRTSIVQAEKVEKENLDSVKQASLFPSKEKSKLDESTVKKSVAPEENDVPPIQVSSLASAENEIGSRTPTTISNPSTVINCPQTVPARSKKRSKKSKPNFSVLSLRHSRRLSKFNKANRCQNSDQSATDERISLRRHPRKNNKKKVTMKPSKSNKKKDAQNKSKIMHSLRKRRGGVKVRKTDKDGSFVSCTLRRRHLNLSKENVRRLASSNPRKTRNLKSKKIVQDQTAVTSTKTLGSSSIAKTQIRHAEKHEENCGQKRRNLRPPPLVDNREGNDHVRTTFKNKRRRSQKNTGQVTKRKPSSSRVNYLQQQSCKSDTLLNNFEGSLKTHLPNEDLNLTEVEINSINDCNKTLLNSEVDDVHSAVSADVSSKSVNMDVKGRESKKRTRLGERKNEEGLNTEPNGGRTFELSMQSSINSRGFHSSEICDSFCDQKIKDEMSEELVIDASVSASDLEILGRDVGVESYANEDILPQNSGGQSEEGLARSSDEDYIAPLSKGTCVAKEAVKSKNLVSLPKYSAKKCIVCKYCGQSFRHISAYTVHQRIHTGEKPYRCKLCGKNFAQLSKLKFHRKIHMQPEALCCPCCSKKFSQKNSLLSHFRIHLKESKQNNKPDRNVQCRSSALSTGSLKSSTNHMCIICDSIFPNKFMLKLHMHMHEEKPLSCKTCGKEFQKSSQLLVHEKTHWPVKPYACSVCGKGFTKLQALKKHSQEHTGETPFSCYHCGHAFRDLSELRVHQVSERCIVKGKLREDNCDIEGLLVSQGVDGQVNTPVFFKCKICRQIYQKWCQYSLHLATHTKSPPYLCVACGQTYEKNSGVSFHCSVCCQYSGEEVACNASLSEIFAVDVQKDALSQTDSTFNPESLQSSKTKNLSVPSESKTLEDSQTPDNPSQKADFIPQPSEFMEVSSETLPLVNNDVIPINQHSGLPSNDSLKSTDQRNKQYKSLCAHKQTHTPHFKHSGKSFERRSTLGLNQRIHVKRRCYSCLQCNIQFRFFGSYKEHLLNHAGERPFTCPETFVHAQSVCANQSKIHQPSKVLRCDVCAKTFNNLRNLLKHCLLHKDAASHQCLSCKLSFTNNKILQEHLKTHNNSVDLQLPEVPSKPLAFPHKCKKCKASFSTGDLLYAHQIRHFRGQVCSPNVNESTSSVSKQKAHPPPELPRPSTSRPLISTLSLDAIANESLYTYPHPDKLYVTPNLSRRCPQIIYLDSEDEENLQPASSSHTSGRECSKQTVLEKTPICSEMDSTPLPQSSQSPKSPHGQSQSAENIPATCTPGCIKDKASQISETATINFVETIVFIEDPTTTEMQEQSESFECVDCSYKTSSLLGLHEHHFLHALGNRSRDKLNCL